jgi:A118 family predicted phage portal protein
MNVQKLLREIGYSTIDSSFYRDITRWKEWYSAYVKGFHSYSIYNGKTTIRRKRYGLHMAKKVCEDLADLLLNEKTIISIDDEVTEDYVLSVLEENRFSVMGNEYQERKAYSGTVAYVPFITGEVSQSGEIIDGKIEFSYVEGGDIYPLSWSNGAIEECAFILKYTDETKQFYILQVHELIGNEYVIRNIVTDEHGKIQPPKVLDWVAREIHTGSNKRQFVIDRLNITNNIDTDNPMGIAIFANALDQLAGCDIAYDSYINEFILGRKRIFVAPDMLSEYQTDTPAFDPNDVVFYQLPEGYTDNERPIKEVDMNLRTEEHSRAISDFLNDLSFKCGFGTERYKFERGAVQTATEVISVNSDMFRTLKKHELILANVLKELIEIVIRLGLQLHKPLKEDAEIKIQFDDSIIEDRAAEREQDLRELAAGIMSPVEYRARWYGESEEEAEKALAVIPKDTEPSEE